MNNAVKQKNDGKKQQKAKRVKRHAKGHDKILPSLACQRQNAAIEPSYAPSVAISRVPILKNSSAELDLALVKCF